MTKEERMLFDVLTLVGIPALPAPFEPSSGRIWVDAVAMVTMRSGKPSIALVRNVWGGAPVVRRMFESGVIRSIDSIHPYSYLDAKVLPDLNSVPSLKAFVQKVYGVDAARVKPLSKDELIKLAISYAIKVKSDADAIRENE